MISIPVQWPFGVPPPPAEPRALLAFFLPRLLATDGANPAAWVQARGLQQLGERVLAERVQAERLAQGNETALLVELRRCQQRLHYLGRYLDTQQDLVPYTSWDYAQLLLQQTMPLVDRLLAEQQAT